MNAKSAVIALGSLFGVNIYRLKQGKTELENIKEELSLIVPVKFHTVESVRINRIEEAKQPGGVKVVLVNGGKTSDGVPLSFPVDSKLEPYPSDAKEAGEKWFPDYEGVVSIAKAFNEVERNRVKAIITNLQSQMGELDRIDEEHENMLELIKKAASSNK